MSQLKKTTTNGNNSPQKDSTAGKGGMCHPLFLTVFRIGTAKASACLLGTQVQPTWALTAATT